MDKKKASKGWSTEEEKKQDKQTPKNAAVNEKEESPKPSHSHTYKKHAFDLV